MSKRRVLIAIAAAMAVTAGGVTAAASSAADGGGGGSRMRATMTGAEEVPAISTTGNGSFSARQTSPGVFAYELTYSGLESPITQSHIHFGQKDVNGGVSVFLCTNLGNGPVGTPLCPGTTSGTITGTFNAASVVGGAAAQGILLVSSTSSWSPSRTAWGTATSTPGRSPTARRAARSGTTGATATRSSLQFGERLAFAASWGYR